MPIILKSTYDSKRLFLPNGHFETIYPSLFRKVEGVDYERERLTTTDGDFLDLDWLDRGSRKLLLLTHGLEGNSGKAYITGMAKYFADRGWDVLAWNCRSCSGEMNRSRRMYHHGEIGDIGEVIAHALHTKDYGQVALVGFSMGGNILMKYLGVHGKEVPSVIRSAVAFSSPTDLKAGAEILDHASNIIYRNRFMYYLKKKMLAKNEQYPGIVDVSNFKKIKIWRDFDEYFSAPFNEFKNADEFYELASAKNFMAGISIPTLLVSALNDPILPPECYPRDICEKHPHIFLEMPRRGGHVGFLQRGKKETWSEERAWEFVLGVGN